MGRRQKQSSAACSPKLPSLKSDVVIAAVTTGNVASVTMSAASMVDVIQFDNGDDLNDDIHNISNTEMYRRIEELTGTVARQKEVIVMQADEPVAAFVLTLLVIIEAIIIPLVHCRQN